MSVARKRVEAIRVASEFLDFRKREESADEKSTWQVRSVPQANSDFFIFLRVVCGTLAFTEDVKSLKVGDSIQSFSLEDQFGDPQRVDENTTLILLSRDREGANC